jgi:hypothetical protein
MAKKYPHLLPEDAAVWDRYMDTQNFADARLYYDVRVGEGRPVGNAYPDNIQKMARDLSQRRIDVLIERPELYTIVEVTTAASLKAIGQLAVYRHLFTMDHLPDRQVNTLLICSSIDPDLKSYADTYLIPYAVV